MTERNVTARLVAVYAAAIFGGVPGLVLADTDKIPTPTANGRIDRTIADWVVNENEKGDTFVILKGSELCVPSATMAAFGALGLPAGNHFRFRGDDYVSLDSLRPDLTYTWDPNLHLITITIAASDFLPTTIDLRELKPSGIDYRHSASGFVNYDLHESVDGSQRATSLALDSSLAMGPGDLALAGNLADTGFSTSRFSYTVENLAGLTQFQLGQIDQNARTAVPGTLLGISFGRRFALDPYLNTAPIPSLATAVNSPSTVYVYVNGRLIKTQNVAPGILDLSNIPMPDGTNDATVVIAGPDGRRTLNVPFYGTSANLAKGLTDFQFEAALDPTAHVPVASAFYRRGLSDAFTQDVALIGTPGYDRAGSALDLRTHLGTFHAAYDQSREAGGTGGRADLRYNFLDRNFFVGTEVTRSAAGFSTGGWTDGSGLTPAPIAPLSGSPAPQAQLDESLYFGATMGHVAPYLNWERAADASQNGSSSTLGAAIRLSSGALTLAATRQEHPRSTSFSLSFSTNVGRVNATESYDSSTHASSLTAETQRPNGTGSTTLTADFPSLDRLQLDSSANWSKGGYALTLSRDNGSLSGDFDYQGAVGLVGHRIFESQRIDAGFALVRVPGLAGVNVNVEGRPVGRTDGHGDLVVPDLITGLANTIKIDDDDLPLDLHFEQTQQIVSPLGRSGMVIEFPHTRVNTYRGRVNFVVGGRQVTPIEGTATYRAHGRDVSVDISESGELYLNDVESGTYPLHIEADNGVCDATITLPKTVAAFVKFGPVTCTPH